MSERKAKERKPLFEPGSVLGETDILSSVLSSYAQSTGQPEPVVRQDDDDRTPAQEPAPQSAVENARSQATPAAEGSRTVAEPARSTVEVTQPARQPADKTARQPRGARPQKKALVDAQEEAKVRAATPKRLCSYRIPEGLDDWLEEHAFEHRHSGLKKQDLVAQALQLLIVAHSNYKDEDQD